MPENNGDLIFRTSRLNYFLVPLTIVLIPLIGIIILFNFSDDPTIPSPLIPPLIASVFILIGLGMSLYIIFKMRQRVIINEQKIDITTFFGSSIILLWETVTSLEITFTGKFTMIDDVGDLLLAALPSGRLGGAKIKLSGENKTTSVSFIRVYSSEVKKMIEKVNSITKVEAIGTSGRMKSIWTWNFRP